MTQKYSKSRNGDRPLFLEVFTAGPKGFQVTSSMIYGDKDLILIDGQFLLSEGRSLAEKIAATGRKLKAVFVTHGHPDHYWGLSALKEIFPSVKILASSETVSLIKKLEAEELKRWRPVFGDDIPKKPVLPEPFDENQLELEGRALGIIKGIQGDAEGSSFVWIPDLKAVVAGDIVYDNVPLWVMETDEAGRKRWASSLSKIEALEPEIVVGGHTEINSKHTPKAIDFTKRYLESFDKLAKSSKTRDDFISKIRALFPELNGLDAVLEMSADMMFPKK